MCDRGKECTVCLLFGGKEIAASIRIRDATSESIRTHVRDGVRIDRETKKAARGAKYDLEVVPKGVTFKGNITIENPGIEEFEYAKLGALLGSIKFFNNTSRSIGGATSRGFGEVEFKITKILEITPEDYFSGSEGKELSLEDEKVFIDDWLSYAKKHRE